MPCLAAEAEPLKNALDIQVLKKSKWKRKAQGSPKMSSENSSDVFCVFSSFFDADVVQVLALCLEQGLRKGSWHI